MKEQTALYVKLCAMNREHARDIIGSIWTNERGHPKGCPSFLNRICAIYGGYGNRGYPQAETPAPRFRYRGRFGGQAPDSRLLARSRRTQGGSILDGHAEREEERRKRRERRFPAGATGTCAGTPGTEQGERRALRRSGAGVMFCLRRYTGCENRHKSARRSLNVAHQGAAG